jgi:hypothetical protein
MTATARVLLVTTLSVAFAKDKTLNACRSGKICSIWASISLKIITAGMDMGGSSAWVAGGDSPPFILNAIFIAGSRFFPCLDSLFDSF